MCFRQWKNGAFCNANWVEQILGLGSSTIKASREFKALALGSVLGTVCHLNEIMFIRGPYCRNALDSLACQSTTNKIISLNSSDEVTCWQRWSMRREKAVRELHSEKEQGSCIFEPEVRWFRNMMLIAWTFIILCLHGVVVELSGDVWSFELVFCGLFHFSVLQFCS